MKTLRHSAACPTRGGGHRPPPAPLARGLRRGQRDPARAAAAAAVGGARRLRHDLRRGRQHPAGRDAGVGRRASRPTNPDATINYDPSGSGAGRTQFEGGGVDYAGSDAYITGDEIAKAQSRCGGDYVEVPVYISPIAIVYNLPGVTDLQLSPSAHRQDLQQARSPSGTTRRSRR